MVILPVAVLVAAVVASSLRLANDSIVVVENVALVILEEYICTALVMGRAMESQAAALWERQLYKPHNEGGSTWQRWWWQQQCSDLYIDNIISHQPWAVIETSETAALAPVIAKSKTLPRHIIKVAMMVWW